MYSDLIDSVRGIDPGADGTLNEPALIRAESFLFKSLINGNRPTLTLAQAIDSPAILSIVQNRDQGRHFIKAIEKQYIRISLYGNASHLQGYLLDTLKRNKEEESKFVFSNMPFLYTENYTDANRDRIFSALIEQIQRGDLGIDQNVVDKSDKDYINHYVETIRKINNAATASYIQPCAAPKQLKDVISLRSQEYLDQITENEALKRLLVATNKTNSNYRSYYYKFLDDQKDLYPSLVIEEVRALIDACYNEVVASTINDYEHANINISSKYPGLAAASTNFSSTQAFSKEEIFISEAGSDYMTWERLMEMIREIETIKKNLGEKGKTCQWEDALRKYSTQQSRLPFNLSAKYVGITALTVAISSIPLVGNMVSTMASDFLWSSACDMFGESLRKPSFSEIASIAKESQKRCKILKMADSQISRNVQV